MPARPGVLAISSAIERVLGFENFICKSSVLAVQMRVDGHGENFKS